MTEYYNEEENANFHTLRYFVFYFALNEYHFRAFSSVEEGEIVAARYSDENSYYRYDCCLPLKFLAFLKSTPGGNKYLIDAGTKKARKK